MNNLFYIILFLGILNICYSAECHGKPGPIHDNNSTIMQAQPKFIKSVPNGKLYQIGSKQQNNLVKLIHVYGNMYQMGFAQGTLLKQELNDFVNELWDYMQSEFTSILPSWFPKRYQKFFAGKSLSVALDLTFYATKLFTNNKYYQQLKGIADASGTDFKLLRRIHMIGELTKGTCSMFGAWGKSTASGKTIQLRSLDWDFDGPYWKVPLLTVYHPSLKKLGNTWMNIGFFGWIGVISGINEHRLAISEIGVYFTDETWGTTSRIGDPFTFVLRDILQFDKTLNQSIATLQNSRRTCTLLLGVGDGKLSQNSFKGFQYSHSVLNVIGDIDLKPVDQIHHPVIENVVYWGMDWNCIYYSQRFAQMLNQYYGQISPEITIRHILPSITSGNLQAVVYDLTDNEVYIAYGFVDKDNNRINAYDRPFLKLKMNEIFNQKQK